MGSRRQGGSTRRVGPPIWRPACPPRQPDRASRRGRPNPSLGVTDNCFDGAMSGHGQRASRTIGSRSSFPLAVPSGFRGLRTGQFDDDRRAAEVRVLDPHVAAVGRHYGGLPLRMFRNHWVCRAISTAYSTAHGTAIFHSESGGSPLPDNDLVYGPAWYSRYVEQRGRLPA